jgi:hypothetical protein
MRDGDIYFWRYADESGGDLSTMYHCKSRKVVVINGRLIDTFWSSGSDGKVIDPSCVVLEFKGNKADLRAINHWELKYYDAADVVDMRHGNSMRAEVYVKSTAVRSRDAMLEHIANMRREQESILSGAKYRLELLDKSEADVMAGKLDTVSV